MFDLTHWTLGAGGGAVYTVLGILIFIGWVLNIVKLCQTAAAPRNLIFILRIIGIFIPPFGAVLGFFV